MKGLETITKFGCLSDEQRWNANRYKLEWMPELDDNDRQIIMLLDCLCDGEYSGQASSAQFYDLMIKEMDEGYPNQLACDWYPIFSYLNIIVYEEMRHGIVTGMLYNFVASGDSEYIKNVNVREYGKKYMWCYESRRYWNIYSYLLAHLFAEVVNTELYRDVMAQVHHPDLKKVINNIMSDEARHTSAWTALIKDLINADPAHKEKIMASLDRGLTHHNAMVHETFFEGLNKMMPLFLPESETKSSAVVRIANRKHKILNELLGDDNPYSKQDVVDMHINYLVRASGYKRATYSAEEPGDIKFG